MFNSFFIIGCILACYAYFCRVIYGGVYWGKLKYWNDWYSQTDHLWLITLLQWIFGICVPFASDVMNCMIIHSTRKSNWYGKIRLSRIKSRIIAVQISISSVWHANSIEFKQRFSMTSLINRTFLEWSHWWNFSEFLVIKVWNKSLH